MKPYICKCEPRYREIGLMKPISYEGVACCAFGFWFFVVGIEWETRYWIDDGWHLLKDLFRR